MATITKGEHGRVQKCHWEVERGYGNSVVVTFYSNAFKANPVRLILSCESLVRFVRDIVAALAKGPPAI